MASGSVISVDVQIILLVTADPLKQRAVAVGIVLENNQMLRLYNQRTTRMDLNLLFKLYIQTVMKVRMEMFEWPILGMEEVTLCVLEWRSKECQPMVLWTHAGADISIIGGNLFKKVATVARLRKRDFKPTDKTPRNYDGRTFSLDGRMDLEVTFNGKSMITPVYIRMDAEDQLLLSEGVCRQLGIVNYDPLVEVWRGGRQTRAKNQERQSTKVPTVRVRLLQTTRLLPQQSVLTRGEVIGSALPDDDATLLVEPSEQVDEKPGVVLEPTITRMSKDNTVPLVVTNTLGFTHKLDKGMTVGDISFISEVIEDDSIADSHTIVNRIDTAEKEEAPRKEALLKIMENEIKNLPTGVTERFTSFLADNHEAFALSDSERGETNLTSFSINTGDATPKRIPMRRMPFAVRQEVSRQLKHMQRIGVIKPSSSPWASPIVLVRKKDGTLRFCVDYRKLNSVTKDDIFPLPRIDDLLDQLGQAKYFTTLDLASGYWQIPVHYQSQEKTAFITHQGLFEFRVMPFGLKNAPAAFQRLMQTVLRDLNPGDGPDFVSVYLDDILIFSQTLEDHFNHLQKVVQRIKEANLKLKPSKCHFLHQEIDYLGHVISAKGLKPNPKLTEVVQQFPVPKDIKGVRQFLGLSSYYRRFVPSFAKIAQPLYALTRKEVPFQWMPSCQDSFLTLKKCLTEPPVLAYPDFNLDFYLETDASAAGLGAVLSQKYNDRLHPIAYASRSLSPAEKNYGITDLETLAVVWACQHFHAYLYGHKVTIYTDHSAVKAVLETPSPSGKHARWWMKVYGAGVKEVNIIYRPGKDNANADALSRNPVMTADLQSGEDIQVAVVKGNETIEELLQAELDNETTRSDEFGIEQRKDPEVLKMFQYIENETLPEEEKEAKRIVLQSNLFTVTNDVLYFIDSRQNYRKRAVVPNHLRQQIMKENHCSQMAGHFSGNRLYKTLARSWWWSGMYHDTIKFAENCPQCAIATGSSRSNKPPLHPIPVDRIFQIFGVDVMAICFSSTRSEGNYFGETLR